VQLTHLMIAHAAMQYSATRGCHYLLYSVLDTAT
jgi:hypothetical protein